MLTVACRARGGRTGAVGDCRLNSEPLLQTAVHGDRLELKASGAWTTAHAQSLERLRSMLRLNGGAAGGLTVDVSAVEPLDTMGALVIDGLIRDYERDGR